MSSACPVTLAAWSQTKLAPPFSSVARVAEAPEPVAGLVQELGAGSSVAVKLHGLPAPALAVVPSAFCSYLVTFRESAQSSRAKVDTMPWSSEKFGVTV